MAANVDWRVISDFADLGRDPMTLALAERGRFRNERFGMPGRTVQVRAGCKVRRPDDALERVFNRMAIGLVKPDPERNGVRGRPCDAALRPR